MARVDKGRLGRRLEVLWPAVVSALLLLLAFPPFNLGLLSLVALVPWLIHIKQRPERGWRSGYVLGLVYGVGQLYWLGAFVARWTGTWLIGILPIVVCTVLFALYFGLAGWLAATCWRTGRPWMIPLVWAGVEVFRSYIPVFAFPWGLVSTPLWPFLPLNQAAYFGTIYLVSAWCVLVSVLIAMIMEGEGLLKMRPLAYGFVLVLVLSMVRLAMQTPTERFVVTVGQPGVDMAFGDKDTEFSKLKAAIEPILTTAGINGSQLAVLPEGVADAHVSPPRTPFALPAPVPVLFGAQRGKDPSYQSAYLYDGKFHFVDKTRLVIFGEFVPLRGVIPYPDSFRLPAGDLSAGTEGVRSVDAAGVRIGPVLCFEALFPDIAYRQLRNGARMLAVMSIDDWYIGSPAPDVLRASSIWRSIENGTPLVRAASLGYTLATDDHGRVVSQVPIGGQAAMRVEVGIPRQPTGFPLLPLFPTLAFLSLFAALWSAFRSKQHEAVTDGTSSSGSVV